MSLTGTSLAAIRVIKRMSQIELAKRVGCNHSLLARIERGERKITPKMEQRLGDELNVQEYHTAKIINAVNDWERVVQRENI